MLDYSLDEKLRVNFKILWLSNLGYIDRLYF